VQHAVWAECLNIKAGSIALTGLIRNKKLAMYCVKVVVDLLRKTWGFNTVQICVESFVLLMY
jgi:hypothetical protein